MDDTELLTLLSPPPKHWDWFVPPHLVVVGTTENLATIPQGTAFWRYPSCFCSLYGVTPSFLDPEAGTRLWLPPPLSTDSITAHHS